MTAYAEIPAINWSSLKHIGVSPLMYQWRIRHPEEEKPAFVFGGAVHCAILEPETFDQRYSVYDGRRDPRVKDWQAWQEEHPGITALRSSEMERVRMIAAAVLDDRNAGPLLRGGRREEVVTWTDEQTGLPCKGRLDYLRPDFVIDLKTTRDPAYRAFQSATFRYGYQAQCAFYHDGAVAARHTSGRAAPTIIAVQTKGPPDVAVYTLDWPALDHGRKVYRSMLQQLVACRAAKHWPGVCPEPQVMTLPPWAETQGITVEDVEDF